MPEHSAPSFAMRCVVVTPEVTVLDELAEFVAAPLFDGEIGLAPRRSPMLGRLGYGELRVTQQGQTRRWYVDGGFIEVADNVVSILTNRAIPAEQLDAEVAGEHLQTARGRAANSPELMEIRDRAVAQARAQLRLAKRAS